MIDKNTKLNTGRRKFIGNSLKAGAAFMIVPRHVLGGKGFKAPSDKLNVACVGVGGKGRVDVHGVRSENIIALCDVDMARAKAVNNYKKLPQNAFEAFPKAKVYEDFREMLEKEKEIDAVTISTPDHVHAIVTMTAMKMGKHVYTQKPLTRTIHESRMITNMAKKMGVVTQMGNQGHANIGPRILNELIWQGSIGNVEKVHCWTDRPIWPQGIKERPSGHVKIPKTLNWDLWLGPAPYREYQPDYVPFSWRAWWDFGCGALGDMGCHIMDYPFWALKLKNPLTVEASSTPVSNETAPHAAIIKYLFPSGISQNEVEVLWYDGGLKPFMPKGLITDASLWKQGSGVVFEGSEGTLVYGHHKPKPVLIKKGKEVNFEDPTMVIPRSIGHYKEWLDEIKGGENKAMSNFEYAGPLNEAVLLGNVAIRAGKKINWNPQKLEISNDHDANKFLYEEYRTGWSL